LKIGADATMREFNVGHKIWPIAYRDSEYWQFLKPKSSGTLSLPTYLLPATGINN